MRRTTFNDAQRGSLRPALDRAEALVAERYRISHLGAPQYPFEVQSAAELPAEEIVDHAFASITRHRSESPRFPTPSRRRDFFRIGLQDHVILQRLADDAPSGLTLDALLLAVLTHELVHVVRFCKHLQTFDDADEGAVEAEERVVEATTAEILGPLRLAAVDAILARYPASAIRV